MINKVTNHTDKSWKSDSNLSSVEFSNVNIAFGHNGAGKSSLARGIYQESISSGVDEQNIRFFDSRYVKETLLLDDETQIKGVVSSFGKIDVDIEKKIKNNNTRISEIDDKFESDNDARDKLVDNTDKAIKDIVTRRKENNKKINNKPSDKTIQETVKLWTDDYDKAIKEFPDEDYVNTTGGKDFSAESAQVNGVSIPTLPERDTSLISELSSILSTSYSRVDIPESEVVSWLEAGLHIHNEKQMCEFCGNKLDLKKIKDKVENYLDDERHKAEVQLGSYRESLVEVKDTAMVVIDNKAEYTSILDADEELFKGLQVALDVISDCIDTNIKQKMADMSETKLIPETLEGSLGTVEESLSKLSEQKVDRTNKINERINRLEIIVKGAIGLEVTNSSSIKDNLSQVKELDIVLRSLEDEKKALNQDTINLEAKKSDLADFATFLNNILQDLGLNFKLQLNGKVYTLKHANGAQLSVSDISDGEINLLALIYFYYEMLGDKEGNLKERLEVIIIDDPISSLDDSNKFYISELIKSLINQQEVQFFVLTHSWDDFCNLVFGQNGKDSVSVFEIIKHSGKSGINKISSERLAKPYKTLYKEVFDFSKKPTEDIEDSDVLHMPNVMRRVLEEYLKFVVDMDYATARKSDDVSRALFNEETSRLSKNKQQKLGVLLSVCNILSHKTNQPKNGTEVHDSAKFLMSSIKEASPFHHHKMSGVM